MSISSKESEPCRRAGFTLFEALVALVVAGLLLPTLGRAVASAWRASRTSMDVVSAATLARDVADGLGAVEARGYAIARSTVPVGVEVLPSDLPPPPAPSKGGKGSGGLDPDAVPATMRLAIPKSFNSAPPGGGPVPPSSVTLRRFVVAVTTPAGRRVGFSSIRLDAPRP